MAEIGVVRASRRARCTATSRTQKLLYAALKVEALAAAVAEVLAREAAAEGVAAALLGVRVVDVLAAVVPAVAEGGR